MVKTTKNDMIETFVIFAINIRDLVVKVKKFMR